jgi:hypothetical protein
MLESNLLKAQKLLSLRQIVVGVSRSVNDILTSVSLRISQQPTVAQEETHTTTIDMLAKAHSLLRQVRDVAEERTGLKECVDLNETLGDAIEFMRASLGDQYPVLFSAAAESLNVQCDEHLIIQSVNHLLDNAHESYSEPPGAIEITLGREEIGEDISLLHAHAKPGSYARITVKDEGCGMSTETLAQAFEPLFTTKQRSGHAGLGLSTVLAIVRAHGGFLTTASNQNKGTAITLYYPLAPHRAESDQATSEPADITQQPSPEIKSLGIRVTSDELRETLHELCAQHGIVTCKISGISELGGAPPIETTIQALCIDSDGISLAEAISLAEQCNPTVTVVVLTSTPETINEEGFKRPVVVVKKPFTAAQFLSALHAG